jgi:hypothetical protein
MIRNLSWSIVAAALVLALLVPAGFAGEDNSPRPAGVEGKKVRGPGEWPVEINGVVLCTDNDPGGCSIPMRRPNGNGDRGIGTITEYIPLATVYRDLPNWDKAVAALTGQPDNSIRHLYLSGHGSRSGGGVSTLDPKTHLVLANLKDEHVKILKNKLTADATIVLYGCHCACSDQVIELATLIDRRVVANTGIVKKTFFTSNNGEGDWVEFRPPGYEVKEPEVVKKPEPAITFGASHQPPHREPFTGGLWAR